ncbi:MAG: type ISP restriction/modification enzyme, partial [bacterium]
LEQTELPGLATLSEEAHLAGRVKRETPILVIMGNPPYSGHSANTDQWIKDRVRDYHKVDGKPLGERNPKWLQDDYVKFIRFAQWKIDQACEGVLGFITNHSYLDNPTFRGMRYSLMQSFDEIYVLDLHGNSLKKEKCPDGSKDENVFDIRQGVAISLFIKKRGKGKTCQVHHAEIYGLRESKYNWLFDHDMQTTEWQTLKPKSEHFLFIPRDEAQLAKYQSFPKITDIFPTNSVGIVTARDHLTIHRTPEEVWRTVTNFARLDPETARLAYDLGEDVRDWKVELAQKDLKANGPDKKHIVPILYRPFDIRYTYYTGRSRGFHCMPRQEVMQHMLKENIGLVVSRQADRSGSLPIFATKSLIDAHSITTAVSISYIFPLYLYRTKSITAKRKLGTVFVLFEPAAGYTTRMPNISQNLLNGLTRCYGKVAAPEQIFAYIYAVFYSNLYRTKYTEFLKLDFPRVPFTADHKLFSKLAELGQRLVDLHLVKSSELDKPIVRFQGKEEGRIEKLNYDEKAERIWINPKQYFEGVTEEVWQYRIGGYQVCHKWLKERQETPKVRKAKPLSLDEIQHYCRMVTAIYKTIEIQKEIDQLYPEIEKKLLSF